MEQSQNKCAASSLGAATHEPASPACSEARASPPEDGAKPPDSPVLGFVEPLISDCLNETFLPGGRKPRGDGWLPDKIAGFLRALAACGVVEDSCKMVGLSASSAYAFRNRRDGRAFARMWDAILIHRSRARLSGELTSRSMNGCVEAIRKDGEVIAERHRYDNRLSMAMLSRLDRLAEREGANAGHLLALSEDMEDFIDCVVEGGDADAFVAAREPPPEPEPAAAAAPGDGDLATLATLTGNGHLLDLDPAGLDVLDLDPSLRHRWRPDQWVRALRSGFLRWLAGREGGPGLGSGPEAACQYEFERSGERAAQAGRDRPDSPLRMREEGRAAEIDTADLDLHPKAVARWTDDQWARAWCSGFLGRVPKDYWIDLAAGNLEEERGQSLFRGAGDSHFHAPPPESRPAAPESDCPHSSTAPEK